MKVLKARLYDLKLKEQQDRLSQIGGAKKDIAFGSQIRSYVLQPYQMIKDHRTKHQEGQVDKVLNGDIEPASLEEIGRRLGITRERVRQIESEALERLAVQREIEALRAA